MRENFVGFYDFAETVCVGLGVGWGVIWMVLFDEVVVAGFYVLLGCISREIEDFVGCWVCVCGPCYCRR